MPVDAEGYEIAVVAATVLDRARHVFSDTGDERVFVLWLQSKAEPVVYWLASAECLCLMCDASLLL